jgi:nitrogen fixation NifU-like protein
MLSVTVGIAQVDDDLYREIILDHYRNPRRRGSVANASGSLEAENPLCGDELCLTWRLDGDRLEEIAFTGRGCSISQAAASMLCDQVAGLPRQEAVDIAQRYRQMLVGEGRSDELGDLEALQGVKAYPVRVKCAALACSAILRALGSAEEGDAA